MMSKKTMGTPMKLLCAIAAGFVAGRIGFLVVAHAYSVYTPDQEATVASVGKAFSVGIYGGAAFFLIAAVLVFRLLK